MTVIKGTFPVRFRVDGKDGEGLWVRYAVTLDKWDDTLQKSYPSNMFTIPTGDCIYIGIAVGAGNAPTDARYYDWQKFVGVDGQSFIIRGVCEEVYSYDVFYDEVEKVVGKVYLLEDYDSDTFNALAVRWTDNGAEDLGAVDGDAYVKSSNKVLFVKNKNLWQDLGSIQGPKGDPGEPGKDGEDAVSYKLSSSISALPLNNDGSPQITSFTLSAVKRKGATVVPFDENYILFYYIYHNSDTRPNYESQWLSSSISSMTVNLTNINDIKNISCSLKYRENNAYKTLDSFDILPIKAGAAGVSYFPNMRGYWKLGETYQWQGMSRDMVVWRADGDDKPYLYAVKTAGTTVEDTLSSPNKNTGEWEKAASPFSMLFANFVYTDNASVAGFKWSDEVMQSPNGLLELNGKTGKITAKSGKIGVVDISTTGALVTPYWSISAEGRLWCAEAQITGKITATSGTFDNCTINETCKAGFMKYATNKFNGNIINCGFVDFNAGYGITGSTTLYLPSVSEGEYMKIIVSNFITTKTYFPDFTLAVEGNGTLHDLFDYPLGVYTKKTLSIGRMAYYEFTGINEQGYSRWICTNSMFT